MKTIYLLIIIFIIGTTVFGQPAILDYKMIGSPGYTIAPYDTTSYQVIIRNLTKEESDALIAFENVGVNNILKQVTLEIDKMYIQQKGEVTLNFNTFINDTNRHDLYISKSADKKKRIRLTFKNKPTNSNDKRIDKNTPSIKRSIYLDAIDLSEFLYTKDDMKSYDFLTSIFGSNKDSCEYIKNFFMNNPFFYDPQNHKFYFDTTGICVKATIQKGSPISIQSLLGSAGGIDVTSFAVALADLYIEKAKEELNIAFFEKFKKTVDDPRYADLKILFPATYKSLMNIDKNIYQFKNYLNQLREAMLLDLSQLDENGYKVIIQDKYKKIFTDYPGVEMVVKSGLLTAYYLHHKKHPGDLISRLAIESYNDSSYITHNYVSFLKLLDLFSQSLRSIDTNVYWVSAKDIYGNLLSNDKTLRIYFGLLYEKLKKEDILFYDQNNKDILSMKSVFEEIAKPEKLQYFYSFRDYIDKLIRKGEIIDNLVVNIKENNHNGKNNFDNYYRFFNASVDFIELAFAVDGIPEPKFRTAVQYIPVEKYVSTARLGSTIVLNIKEQNYSSAVLNVADLLNNVFSIKVLTTDDKSNTAQLFRKIQKDLPDTGACTKETFIKEVNGYLSKPTPEGITALKQYESVLKTVPKDSLYKFLLNLNTDNFSGTMDLFLKYGTFSVNLVNAKSSDDIKSVLESAALPVGSYKLKRLNPVTISLTGYLGISGGWQYEQKKWNGVIGPWAPLGPELTISLSRKCATSLSLYFPLIDIGAMALYRFSNDSTEMQTNITLAQILSPGVFLCWGLPNLPISLSVGYQLYPLLKSVKTGQTNIADGNYSRIIATLAVDLPLLNFYSKSKDDARSPKVNCRGKLKFYE